MLSKNRMIFSNCFKLMEIIFSINFFILTAWLDTQQKLSRQANIMFDIFIQTHLTHPVGL